MQAADQGPLPVPTGGAVRLPAEALAACPGRAIMYPELCHAVFGRLPENWLIGCYRHLYLGYATDQGIRRQAASAGIITQTLIHLLQEGRIDGAVVVRQGSPKPWLAEPVIARTVDEIRAASQSVYAPIPVNAVLDKMSEFSGKLAYVGLPDQVASLRRLQQLNHPGACKVSVVLGPYVGTNLYANAIAGYLRANGVSDLDQVTRLRYREGEWPGYLQIETKDGRVLRAEKFYYNYLIPFYITRSTLQTVDFTNELTDLSVGDAWNPSIEARRGGFSVVVARTETGERLLREMVEKGLLSLAEISVEEGLSMHGHMLDFKKRGSFIRMGWRSALGRPTPDYGYSPSDIPLSRQLTELVISMIFVLCGTSIARRLVELIPIGILGPTFDTLRKSWKQLSKPAKRRGLTTTDYVIHSRQNSQNN